MCARTKLNEASVPLLKVVDPERDLTIPEPWTIGWGRACEMRASTGATGQASPLTNWKIRIRGGPEDSERSQCPVMEKADIRLHLFGANGTIFMRVSGNWREDWVTLTVNSGINT
jgi:hypothetical protein